jgi:hypothetical protein
MKLTVERARQALRYEPETGEFYWRVWTTARVVVGARAGTIRPPNGYRVVTVDGEKIYEHRLAWFYVHGCWPVDQIDHINGERADNRIANLREAVGSQNVGNTRQRVDSSTGIKGVTFHKRDNRWQAQISVRGKHRHLGQFKTREEAQAAYAKAATEHFGEFARLE